MKPSRLEALADGIFAIVMTLLVLEIHVPHLEEGLSLATAASHAITDIGPKLVSFIVSFMILAIYWSSHHMLFAKLKEINFRFMWLNVYFLMTISLIPFSTAFIGSYPLVQASQIFYALNLIIGGLILFHMIKYAVFHGRLTGDESASREFKINVTGKILFPAATYLLAIAVSFFEPRLSLALLVVGPLIYFIPIDTRLWQALTGRAQ